MPAILAIVTRLLGLVAELLGIAHLIQGHTEQASREHSPYLIEGIVTTAGLTIAHPTWGLEELRTQIDDLAADIAALNAPVLAAIAALPAGSAIPTAAQNASEVWSTPLYQVQAYWGSRADTHLGVAAAWANTMDQTGRFGLAQAPDFSVDFLGNGILWNTGAPDPPNPDYDDILPGENVAAWLNRTDTVGRTWLYDATLDLAYSYDHMGAGDTWDRMWCNLHTPDLQALARASHPPIWPGVAGVTWGTTVPCAASTVLEVPMDGLVILITAYPATRARWGAAPYLSVYHTGRLAFITDNGDAEPFQYMGWTNAIYTPQTMTRAGGVVIFLEPNIEAAATPWDLVT